MEKIEDRSEIRTHVVPASYRLVHMRNTRKQQNKTVVWHIMCGAPTLKT